jgi:hypothetical protein
VEGASFHFIGISRLGRIDTGEGFDEGKADHGGRGALQAGRTVQNS